jgi:hypothetical protein
MAPGAARREGGPRGRAPQRMRRGLPSALAAAWLLGHVDLQRDEAMCDEQRGHVDDSLGQELLWGANRDEPVRLLRQRHDLVRLPSEHVSSHGAVVVPPER